MLANLIKRYPESSILQYAQKCKSGEVIVGNDILLQLDILVELFENSEILLDFEYSNKIIVFIQKECKHFEAPFAGQPFLLELWQKAFVESIFLFKVYNTEIDKWVRKHQEVLLEVGKKNGKTPLIAALCLACWFCGPIGSKILGSSNDYEQASLMYDAINAMREASPTLAKVTRSNVRGIYFGDEKKKRKKGKFSWANKGNIRKISARKKANEGRNIIIGAFDEVHELADDKPTMPIRQGISTQDEGLYIEITTEGFVRDGYLDKRNAEATKVLNRELERPDWVIWRYTQDSEAEVWQDEKSWPKSNPNLGVSKKWSYMRKIVNEARTNMETRVHVLSKDLNIPQNAANTAFAPEVYINESIFNAKDFIGCYCMGAADLAITGDLCNARIMIMRRNDPVKYMITRYFIPESKLGTKDDDLDYDELRQKGLVTVGPGNDLDLQLVTQWFVDTISTYNLRLFKCFYDNALAKFWKQEMSEIFDDVDMEVMERVIQKHEYLSNPFTLLATDLLSRLINYGDHEIDRKCLRNVCIDTNRKGLIMPCKPSGNNAKKIDGVATMVMCEYGWQIYKTEFMRYVNMG